MIVVLALVLVLDGFLSSSLGEIPWTTYFEDENENEDDDY